MDTNIRLRREQKPYSKLANSKSAYVSAHVANQESDKRVSHGLNFKKIAFRAAQRLRCIYTQMHDTVCKHTPFNFCYNISLSLSSTEIDSDEPYRAPALEVPGCNEELNAYLRYYLRERVQQFLAEYVEYTGLSTGSGSESYTD